MQEQGLMSPDISRHCLPKSPGYTVEGEEMPASSSEDDEPPTPPPKDFRDQNLTSPADSESFFNSFRPSRADSIYSLSRMSFSSHLSQLTSLNLPNSSALSTSLSSIPTALAAAATLSGAASQIQKWLQKASEVLQGLDAEDDVEWAAAGGREGLVEVDTAIGKFEGVIGIYVTAIEDLHGRKDIGKVPSAELKLVVDQMEKILNEWDNVRKLLGEVKRQVELAMEWEELWNVILGDIGLEMESLSRLVFEMEETRHKAMLADPSPDDDYELDIQELETIVEEAPAGGRTSKNQRFSLPLAFTASTPLNSPRFGTGQEDSSLLALFARMQPLRASLDFLPMTLSNFDARADEVLPTACQELEARRKGLEKKWKKLEVDAEGLRRELAEDRWVLVFRNAGRKLQKMYESVERSIMKLQESIDTGAQHSNPPSLVRRVGDYEGKKLHFGPAIERMLWIIEKAVKDRQSVNGEILRLHLDTRARWESIEAEMKDMDIALDYLNMNKTQQLRDSISSLVSMDRSIMDSFVDTPQSSPASSVAMGPTNGNTNGHKGDATLATIEGESRRSSIISSATTRPSTARRYFSMPPSSAGTTQLPHKNIASRSVQLESSFASRNTSPSPYSAHASSTPTASARPRLSTHQTENKPRWNSSPKVNHFDFTSNHKPPPLSTPSPHRKSSMSFRSPRSAASYSSSNVALPSPLGRTDTASPGPTTTCAHRPRHFSGIPISPTLHHNRHNSSSPAGPLQSILDPLRSKPNPYSPATNGTPPASSRSQSNLSGTSSATALKIPSPRAHLSQQIRPGTALASGPRISMLPLPKHVVSFATGLGNGGEITENESSNGRESILGARGGARSSLIGKGERERKWR